MVHLEIWRHDPPFTANIHVENLPDAEARKRAIALGKDLAERMTPEHLRRPTAELQVFAWEKEDQAKVLARMPTIRRAFQYYGFAPGYPKQMSMQSFKFRGQGGYWAEPGDPSREIIVFSVCPTVNRFRGVVAGLLPDTPAALAHVEADDLTIECPAFGMHDLSWASSLADLQDGYQLSYGMTVAPPGASEGARGYAILLDPQKRVVDEAPVAHPGVPEQERVTGRFATVASRKVGICQVNPTEQEDSVESLLACEVRWTDHPCFGRPEKDGSTIRIHVTPDHKIQVEAPEPYQRPGQGCRPLE